MSRWHGSRISLSLAEVRNATSIVVLLPQPHLEPHELVVLGGPNMDRICGKGLQLLPVAVGLPDMLCWSFWPPSTVKFNHQLQQLYHQSLQQLQLLITTKTPKPATTNILSSIYDTNTIPCLPPALPYKSAPGLASGANKSSRTCREGQSLRSMVTIRVICFKPLQQNSDKMWYLSKAWTWGWGEVLR